jgi:hypothetical protein
MTQAIDEMLVAVRLISDDAQWGYDDVGICMAGVYLREGTTYELVRTFQGGVEYSLIAGGDEDARDVDLQVFDASGERVAADTRADRMAVLKFTPEDSASYTIRLKLFRSQRDAFCSFAVLRRGGWDVPVINLDTARISFLAMCGLVVLRAEELDAQTEFLVRPNQAAVFGEILRAGASTTLRNVDLGTKPTYILTTGDVNARDLDLYLKSSRGTVLASDTDADAPAIVPYLPKSGSSYRIDVANESRNGRAAFVLCGVLQIQ